MVRTVCLQYVDLSNPTAYIVIIRLCVVVRLWSSIGGVQYPTPIGRHPVEQSEMTSDIPKLHVYYISLQIRDFDLHKCCHL